jgi:SAM-dependent methyltransferase
MKIVTKIILKKKYSTITNCRICYSKSLNKVINLGSLAFTGKFWNKNKKVPKAPLELVQCKKCELVQLGHNFSRKFLYSKDYGYRSGINNTMRNHLLKIVRKINTLVELKKNDVVLDIASNDGTLLNSYKNKKIKKFGIDPTIIKFNKYYLDIDYKIANFFNKKLYFSKTKTKAKVITAISVFYDLPDPNKFLYDIKNILHKDGIFLIEQSDLYLMLKHNSVDTICHEHLEYYSVHVIKNLIRKHGLKIFYHEYNKINGGSSRFYICHNDNKKFKCFNFFLKKIIKRERKYGMFNNLAFKKFQIRIKKIGINLKKKLQFFKNNKKLVHGYGASTKGNVTLQYFNIGNYLEYIADRNLEKCNLYTPGSNIKIISEKESRLMSPDYYFVLPWHFKNEILKREKNIIRKGTRFIFPFPKVSIK